MVELERILHRQATGARRVWSQAGLQKSRWRAHAGSVCSIPLWWRYPAAGMCSGSAGLRPHAQELMSEVAHLWPTILRCSAFHRRDALHARAISSKALPDRRGNLGARMQKKYMCTPQNGGSSMWERKGRTPRDDKTEMT